MLLRSQMDDQPAKDHVYARRIQGRGEEDQNRL